jgi:hypothetical protein
VAPTLVPLLSSKYSTSDDAHRLHPVRLAAVFAQAVQHGPERAAGRGQASASAASAFTALWRPRMRSASAGIRRWK